MKPSLGPDGDGSPTPLQGDRFEFDSHSVHELSSHYTHELRGSVFAVVAPMLEHLPSKQRVVSSSLTYCTRLKASKWLRP
jgi:hypothetical protein